MIETRRVQEAVAFIERYCAGIKAEVEKETREGLEADWTAVAEALDSIKEYAEHGAACAWRVAYETDPTSV